MNSLASIDYVIIFAYFALTLFVGLYMTRKASSSLEHYFLAGRSMPWYLLGIAGMTMWFDLTGTMIITSFLYMLGPRGLFIEFRGGAVLVLAFMMVYTGKWHRRSGCMTGAEWMTYRFGEGRDANAVRLFSAIMALVSTVGMLAYLVRGTSLFVGMFVPWSPLVVTMVIVAVTTLYTMMAGFYGVVLTDVVQGIIIMITCVIVGLIAWGQVPDYATLAAVTERVTGNRQWVESLPAWQTSMPRGYEAYEALIMFMLFYLARNVLGGLGAGAEPRYFGAKNDRECGLQSMLQGLTVMLRWPMMIGFAVMGIFMVNQLFPDMSALKPAANLIHQYNPYVKEGFWHDLTSDIINNPANHSPQMIAGLKALLGESWVARLQLVGFHGDINPERILPAVLMNEVPAGLKGVILVAMLAAMMSTFTGTVNVAGGMFVKDIYQRFLRPHAANRELIVASYGSTLIIVVLGCWMGVAAASINNLWGWIVMSLTAGGLAPALLRLYWWRCNAWGMFGGLVLGGIGAVGQRILAPDLSEWWQFLIMTALSFIGTISGSLLTAPTSMERLRHFYRTTRPFGWWGPLRGVFTAEQQITLKREHRNDILAVPFVLLWQVTIFIMPMQLVIKAYDAFWLTLPLLLLAMTGMYFYWWRPLWRPEVNWEAPLGPQAAEDSSKNPKAGTPSPEPALGKIH